MKPITQFILAFSEEHNTSALVEVYVELGSKWQVERIEREPVRQAVQASCIPC